MHRRYRLGGTGRIGLSIPIALIMNVVILAAGQGKRMHSDLPKVLHPIAGKPMLAHVLDTARKLGAGDASASSMATAANRCAKRWPPPTSPGRRQEPQLGTGHAVLQALAASRPRRADAGALRRRAADPCRDAGAAAWQLGDDGALALLTVRLANPQGYGRIVRADWPKSSRIVEEKDADDAERAIDEVNTGILVAPDCRAGALAAQPGQQQRAGRVLPDRHRRAGGGRRHGGRRPAIPTHAWEVEGVNSKVQLAALERIHQRNIADALMEAGRDAGRSRIASTCAANWPAAATSSSTSIASSKAR